MQSELSLSGNKVQLKPRRLRRLQGQNRLTIVARGQQVRTPRNRCKEPFPTDFQFFEFLLRKIRSAAACHQSLRPGRPGSVIPRFARFSREKLAFTSSACHLKFSSRGPLYSGNAN
jgi:hypothetical protein